MIRPLIVVALTLLASIEATAQQIAPSQVRGIAVVQNPTVSQKITQPPGTTLTFAGDVSIPNRSLVVWPGQYDFGDSVCAYVGASSVSRGFVSLIANALGGVTHNSCVSGNLITDEPMQMFGNAPDVVAAGNPATIEEGGINDANQTLTVPGYATNSQLSLNTVLTRRGTTNIVPASAMSQGGAWTADGVLADARDSSSNGSTLSGSITTYAYNGVNGAVCPSWRAFDGNGGQASFKIDGTTVAALNAFGSSPINSGRTILPVFTACYQVVPGTHSFVFTVTSATGSGNVFPAMGVLSASDPSVTNFASPLVFSMGVLPKGDGSNASGTAALNTMKANTVTTLSSYGFPLYFVDVRTQPTAFDATHYISSQSGYTDPITGINCVGSTVDTTHPNDCGHYQEYRALLQIMLPTTLPGVNSITGLGLNSKIISTNYTAQAGDSALYVDSGATLTLPGNLPTGTRIAITNNDAALPMTITGSGSTFVGVLNVLQPRNAIVVENFSTNWFIVSPPVHAPSFIIGSAYSVAEADRVLYVNSGATITLTNGLETGQIVTIVNNDATPVPLTGGGPHFVPTFVPVGASVTIASFGTNWFLIGSTGFSAFGTPASSSAVCTPPQILYDTTAIYPCVALNSWRKVLTTTF